ncbi:MAG: BatD family protein [Bacteroidota bacterium]|nr:BatD family protein [Bacteroidota bacterium]
MVQNASDVETIIPPSFKNFSIVSGPNQQSGMSIVNGKTDQYVAISFYLKPKAAGKYVIGPAIAKVNGKEYYSEPLNVEVTNASNPSSNSGATSLSPFSNLNFDFSPEPVTHQFDDYILKKGENVNDKVQKNLFIKLDVSKTSCYVGEPIVASYKLYTRLRTESVVTNAPSFNGFSVSELELNDNNAAAVEKYNGRDYNVYTLRKVQLYPLQAGTVTLDPVVTDNKVTFIKSEYAGAQKGDMFYDMLQDFANSSSPQNSVVEQHVNLQSKPVQIAVRPLPDTNKPQDFKGAVGNFKISSSLEKNNITTDDAGNVKVILEGEGNIHLINSPKILWPDGIDGYDAKVTDDIDKFSVPMKGSKTFTHPFTVSKAGTYTVPPISFSYFDPSSGHYKTLHTQPMVINVTLGKGNSQNVYAKKLNLQEPAESNIWSKYSPYFISGFVLLMGFTFLIAKRKSIEKKKTELLKATSKLPAAGAPVMKEDTEFVIPENPLIDAHDKMMEHNEIEFYKVLDASLKKYLAAKFKVPSEELTKKRLNEELDKCNIGLGTSLMLTSLLDEVELNVYAPPASTNHLQQVYEKASEVVALLDKQMC